MSTRLIADRQTGRAFIITRRRMVVCCKFQHCNGIIIIIIISSSSLIESENMIKLVAIYFFCGTRYYRKGEKQRKVRKTVLWNCTPQVINTGTHSNKYKTCQMVINLKYWRLLTGLIAKVAINIELKLPSCSLIFVNQSPDQLGGY